LAGICTFLVLNLAISLLIVSEVACMFSRVAIPATVQHTSAGPSALDRSQNDSGKIQSWQLCKFPLHLHLFSLLLMTAITAVVIV
jgi:hypothetical protein